MEQFEMTPAYRAAFGALGRQAAINSVTVYCKESIEKEITLAWLLQNHKRIDELLPRAEGRRQAICGALGAVATTLRLSDDMKYKQLLPSVRLERAS